MISLDLLEEVEVFKDLDDDQLSAVQDCCQETEFRRGDKIFGSKEKPFYLYAVIEGAVELHRDGKGSTPLQNDPISSLTDSMTFGWSSLVPPYEYTLSAYCSSRRCKLLKIDRECLSKLLKEDLKLGYMVMSRIVSVVGTRFHQLREEIIKGLGHDIINRW